MKKNAYIIYLLLTVIFYFLINSMEHSDVNYCSQLAYAQLNVQIVSEIKGDCNGDGLIDIQDAHLANLMITGEEEFNSNADLNNDGKISREDVEIILQIIGEELLFNSFEIMTEADIQECWEQYNKEFTYYLDIIQDESVNIRKKTAAMKRYLRAYYKYKHSIGKKSIQKKSSQDKN